MTDVLDRLRRLVALAASKGTPTEEARTAGVAACRLIVEHELRVSLPGSSVGKLEAGRPCPLCGVIVDSIEGHRCGRSPPPPPVSDWRDGIDWSRGSTVGGAAVDAARAAAGFPRQGRQTLSQYMGDCTWCGMVYARGDVIWLYPKKDGERKARVEHAECARDRVKCGKEEEAYV